MTSALDVNDAVLVDFRTAVIILIQMISLLNLMNGAGISVMVLKEILVPGKQGAEM